MIDILLITIDRFDLTKECVTQTLKTIGCLFNLYAVDNGSKDKRVIEFVESLSPVYFSKHETNTGICPAWNEMILKSKSFYKCIIGNDIPLPDGWGQRLIDYNKKIPNSGLSGIHCVEALPPVVRVPDASVHVSDRVYGTTFFNQNVIDKVGYFCEDYKPYGLGDSDYNIRVKESGFINYYVPGVSAIHQGHDMGENTEYRKMKNESISRALPIFTENIKRMRESGNFYLPCKA